MHRKTVLSDAFVSGKYKLRSHALCNSGMLANERVRRVIMISFLHLCGEDAGNFQYASPKRFVFSVALRARVAWRARRLAGGSVGMDLRAAQALDGDTGRSSWLGQPGGPATVSPAGGAAAVQVVDEGVRGESGVLPAAGWAAVGAAAMLAVCGGVLEALAARELTGV